MQDVMQLFSPVVRAWFERHVGLPTPPQALGWPLIANQKNTLILAPTGSGKTLAAFLAAIDSVARRLLAEGDEESDALAGVQILYVSPLKSLANDVQKNLIVPLNQMEDVAREMKADWPQIRVGIRTGDTPQRDRAALVKKPPHILITTPESLNLLLTSGGRRTLQTVRFVIVDEVHAMAGTKRGVFLSLLLERLEEERRFAAEGGVVKGRRKIAPGVYVKADAVMPLARIGLSATARPAGEVARFLGGHHEDGALREIAIVDAGQRKRLDLQVLCPWSLDDEREGEDKSNWPAVSGCIIDLLREHRSTLIFANSRRLVEKLVGRLQELPDAPEILPHHGSISKEVRLETETRLKRGELKAVVATSSLELGIDIGALDLVCQIDSPGSVAAGLQRVGRAGHLEKATAKGRMIPRQLLDLPQLAALIPLMFAGHVEETRVPQNCLDVLSQQVVACCATRTWNRGSLYRIFKRSAAYAHLAEAQFDSVLDMLSVKADRSTVAGARPQISFDRVNDQLSSLPGTASLAMINGGVIADTGQFAVYIADKNVRIGELDEEFVFESKPGDRIILGSQTWAIQAIDMDRVTVSRAEGGRARMPFWRGEAAPRSFLLGSAVGAFNRTLMQRLATPDEARRWLLRDHHFDDSAVDAVSGFFALQRSHGSAVPTDERIVIEHFRDKTGEPVTAILNPLGSRVNYALRLGLEAAFGQRDLPAQFVHNDDGILIRPGDPERMPENPLAWLASDTLESAIIEQLEHSALFGLRFRQAAARALMLPKINPTKRTPLWQQRLRAKGLLAVVKRQRNHPIVVETYRECLQDTLLIDHARDLLSKIEDRRASVTIHTGTQPSPFARSLWMNFEAENLYSWDDPIAARAQQEPVDRAVLDQILGRSPGIATPVESWSQEDVETLNRRLSGSDYPARVAEELIEKLDAGGPVELAGPSDERWQAWVTDPNSAAAMVHELATARRIVWIEWGQGKRAIATESLALYAAAMGHIPALWTFDGNQARRLEEGEIPAAIRTPKLPQPEARRTLVELMLRRHCVQSRARLHDELALMTGDVGSILDALIRERIAIALDDDRVALATYVDQLRSIALRRERQQVQTVGIAHLQAHLLRWQHMDESQSTAVSAQDELEDTLELLTGLAFPLTLWDQDIFPTRVTGYQPGLLDQMVATGHWVFHGSADEAVSFSPRHIPIEASPSPQPPPLDADAQKVLEFLRKRGASFLLDLQMETLDSDDGLLRSLRHLFFSRLISNDRLESLRAVLLATSDAQRPQTTGNPIRRLARGRRARGASIAVGGRWYVLPTARPASDALTVARAAAERTSRALQRFGFLCRELIDPAADGNWRSLYDVLTRMEWAGQVRRGYFVEGISGSQFALPSVSLDEPGSDEIIWLSMLDPANIYARLGTPWVDAEGQPVRIPRVEGSWIAVQRGVPLLAAVTHGNRLIPLSGDSIKVERAATSAATLLDRLPNPLRHVLTIRQWGDRDIIGSPAEQWLRAAGFARDTQGLRLYRHYA